MIDPQVVPKKVRRVKATGQDLDAVTVWLRGLVHSVVSDPVKAESLFREIPALTGLVSFKIAMGRCTAMGDN